MRRGLQAAVAKMMAPRHPHATIDLIEFGIWLSNSNGTQKPARRDPTGCDASHDLTMFLATTSHLGCDLRLFGRNTRCLTPPRGMCTVPAMPTPKAAKEAQPDFETAMRDLEELVDRLEQGDLPLEESLAAFERGVMLTRACQTALKEAEQKVEILLKKAGEPVVEDFAADESKAG